MAPRKRARKLMVEIVGARNLIATSGSSNGTASAFCTLNYDGVKRQTESRPIGQGPKWEENLFEFNYFDLSVNLEICVYSERKGRTLWAGLLGKVQLKGKHVEKQGHERWFSLEKRGLFSRAQGELRLKVWYQDLKPQQDDPKPKFPLDRKPSLERAPNLQQGEKPPRQHGEKTILQQGEKPALESERKATSDREPEAGPLPAKLSKEIGSKASEVVPTSMVDMFNVKEILNRNVRPAVKNQHSYDLVELMTFLFVKVVRARNLAAKDSGGNGDPYVKISVAEVNAKTQVIPQDLHPEWNRTFAIAKDKLHGQFLEISVWDASMAEELDVFLGALSFLLEEIPSRLPPESPLAPVWYKLEERPGKTRVKGELMMAIWMGNQTDVAFQDAWQSDTGGHSHCESKVYLSPKMWYLRLNVLEAQDLAVPPDGRIPEPFVEIHVGLHQTTRIYAPTAKGVNPIWNKDCLLVAAEPFEELLQITVKDQVGPNVEEVMGVTRISLGAVPRRSDFRTAMKTSWFVLDSREKGVFTGRIHLRLHFEGGYHVFDEHPDFSSCMRPTARQIWKESLGVLHLGIMGATDLLPMHNVGERGNTDAYCVAKYGQKWVRTRTISQNFDPRWNEQYCWEVYDLCTVLTVCVFDNRNANNWVSAKGKGMPDTPIGRVRFRLSTLESGRAYFNSYPLRVVTASGIKKMGELECSIRFTCSSTTDVLKTYFRPPLPAMHYFVPIDVNAMERLRIGAMNLLASRLARFHPPLRKEVVQFMLDDDSGRWSMRRSKANYFRIATLLSGIFYVENWFNGICTWKKPVTTVSVHILFLILVWFPWLLLPIVFFYMFLRGLWNYRFRSGSPPRLDPVLSQGGEEGIQDLDELEEEFSMVSGNKVEQVLKARYERLRGFAGRFQHFIGNLATQGERLVDILNWRDPRATAIFVTFCLTAAVLLLLTPRVVAAVVGVYLMRHPKLRDPCPGALLNFLRRLPSQSDRIL